MIFRKFLISNILVASLIVSGVVVTARAWAHDAEMNMSPAEMKKMDRGQNETSKNASWTAVKLNGEIIDLGCYIAHDGYGKKHKACALTCSKNGVPLALLENKTKKIYMIVATGHGENPFSEPLKFMADQVEVEGAVATKAGTTVLMITSIKKSGAK